MKRFVIECFVPKGKIWRFVTHDCRGELELEQAIFDLKLEDAKRIEVFEMKNVTKDFAELINE